MKPGATVAVENPQMFSEGDVISLTWGRPRWWQLMRLWRWWRGRHYRAKQGRYYVTSVSSDTFTVGGR